MPRLVDFEKSKNLHLLLQHQPPKDIGGEQVSSSIWHDLTWSDHQKQDKVLGDLRTGKPKSGHEHPLEESDVATVDDPSPGSLIEHPHSLRDVVVQPQNTFVPFEEGGFHLAL
jgi:hypothetical protein